MKLLKSMLLFLAAITWCALQTVVGGIMALVLLPNARFSRYRGMIIVYHPFSFTVALGTFAFISNRVEYPRTAAGRAYGFFVQSLILGPFYLFAVILPQLIVRIPFIKKYRAERGISPTDLFTDRQAAYLQARLGE